MLGSLLLAQSLSPEYLHYGTEARQECSYVAPSASAMEALMLFSREGYWLARVDRRSRIIHSPSKLISYYESVRRMQIYDRLRR